MQTNFSSPAVVCRPALPGDKADVLEFTKFIWDGHDYIKYVWDDWLSDPQGLLAVAEYGGRAVALGKASYVAPGQWWLEGLRVDPQFQGLKIASHIFEYLEDWRSEHAGGAFRLMTSSDRVQVHHLCERLGWLKVGDVKSYRAAPTPGTGEAFQPVAQNDVTRALSFASANLAYSGGLINSSWKFAAPDEFTLLEKIRQNQLSWWRGRAGLLAWWDDEDDGETILGVGFIACPMESLEAMLVDIRRLAGGLGFSSVLWQAPVRADVESALKAAGFLSRWDGSAFLFEKKQEP